MATTSVAGEQLHFEVHGSGPSVFAYVNPRVKGPLGYWSRALVRELLGQLGGRYQLVFTDYPATREPGALTPDRVTRDLLAIADAAGVERFTWFGYSFGAVIGLQLAAATDRLDGLVCGGFPPLGGPYDAMLTLTSTYARRLRRLRLPRKVRAGVEQYVTYYAGLADFDDTALQARMTYPRLCYVGSEDHVKLGGQRLTSFATIISERRAELEALGWDVHVLDGHNHRTAFKAEVTVPLLRDWLDTTVGSP